MLTAREAERELEQGVELNPGPWREHSLSVAGNARLIAGKAEGMDADTAYIMGLMHDIGRKFGTRHLGHVYDGWKYMERLGYPEAGRICLTHSFVCRSMDNYIGKLDILPEEEKEVREALAALDFDDFDLLIQLCDAIGTADGPVDMDVRMQDIKNRYGNYPEETRIRNYALKKYFEERAGRDLYSLLDSAT